MKKLISTCILVLISIACFGQHPTNLTTTNINDNSALLSWTDNGCSNGFSLEYRTVGGSWIQLSSGITNPYSLFGLNASTDYEWRVKCIGVSGWSNIAVFTTLSCNQSVTQSVSEFNPDPLYGYMQFAYDTLTIMNTGNCDVRLRPEFIISHEDSTIEVGDFTIEWFNPQFSNWPDINYTIDNNGNAIGFWGTSATDSTGINLASGVTQLMIIRVKFMNPNNNPNPTPTPYGTYTASWTTYEVDNLGNKIQTLAPADTVSLSLVNCNIFTASNYSEVDISCYGQNNGSASINQIINGSGDYSYNWSNGDSVNAISNLTPGAYSCLITDNNWSQCSTTVNFIINEPPALNVINSSITDVLCHGYHEGSIDIVVNGGSAPYTYQWISSNNFTSTNEDLINLSAGNYSLTITDVNNCSESYTYAINEPSSAINLNITSTDITSCVAQDGSIDLSVAGGTLPYNYTWNNGATSEDLSSLIAGNYTVNIIDNNGCDTTNTITIYDFPNTLTIDSLTSPIYNGYNILCNGDSNASIASNLSGNNGTISYLWSNGQNTANINQLSAGTYILTATDSLGCVATDTTIINEPLELFSLISSDTITCYGGSATANILVYGGVSPFIYNWSNGGNNYYTNLYPGTHNVIVTDNNGCLLSDSISINNVDSISVIETSSNVSCFGAQDGMTILNTSGGTPPYQFSANNGLNYQASNTFFNLGAGMHNYLITDINGCINHTEITISQPDSLYINIITTDVSCYGGCDGTAITTVSGGTPPFVINWGNVNPLSLCGGYHNLIVTDNNNCSATTGVSILEPNPIIVNIWQNGNNLETTNNFVTYQWYDNTGTPITGANSSIYTPTIQGEYYVEVTDTNECSINSYSILFSINNLIENPVITNIYPNPTNGKVIIESSKELKSISIINNIGKQVYKLANVNFKRKQATIDLSSLTKGIYLIKLESNNYLSYQRIILQ